MKQTSLEAYMSLNASTIGARQQQIMHTLFKIGPANNREIAEHSGLPINVVTPRVKELREKYRIVETYKAIDPVTNRRTIYWDVKGE